MKVSFKIENTNRYYSGRKHLSFSSTATEACEGSKWGSWGWQTQLDHSQVCSKCISREYMCMHVKYTCIHVKYTCYTPWNGLVMLATPTSTPHIALQLQKYLSSLSLSPSSNPLWHKVDIRDFCCQKNVNFCNNSDGLTIANDLKSKIWKVYGNIF